MSGAGQPPDDVRWPRPENGASTSTGAFAWPSSDEDGAESPASPESQEAVAGDTDDAGPTEDTATDQPSAQEDPAEGTDAPAGSADEAPTGRIAVPAEAEDTAVGPAPGEAEPEGSADTDAHPDAGSASQDLTAGDPSPAEGPLDDQADPGTSDTDPAGSVTVSDADPPHAETGGTPAPDDMPPVDTDPTPDDLATPDPADTAQPDDTAGHLAAPADPGRREPTPVDPMPVDTDDATPLDAPQTEGTRTDDVPAPDDLAPSSEHADGGMPTAEIPVTDVPGTQPPDEPDAAEPADLFEPTELAAQRERAQEPPDEATLRDQPVPEPPRDHPTIRTTPVSPPPPQQPPPQQPPLAPPVPPARIDQTARMHPAETTNLIRPIQERPEEQTSVMRPVPPAPPRQPRQPQQRPPQPPPQRPRPEQQTRPQQRPQRPPVQRAMPVRVEPERHEEPGHDDDHEPRREPAQRRHRRRGRGALVAGLGVLLVVGVVAGVAFFVPGAASKVGLDGIGPGKATADPPAPAQVRLALGAATGERPSADGVDGALREVTGDPALGTLNGEVVDARTGESLWASSAKNPLAPGSTTKLLTAAAALLTLNPQSTLDTKVVAGNKPGDVVIVGGGDPTLSALPAGQDNVYADSAHLDELVGKVEKSGTEVNSVRVDLDRYTGDSQARGWEKADIAAGNFTPIVPGMLDGGRSDPTDLQSPRTDNPAGVLTEEFASRLGAEPAGLGSAPKNAKVLGVVRSAPMVDLVETMLRTSDNVLAEMIGREVARKQGNEPSFDGAVQSIKDTLRANGFDTQGTDTADCSGLSTVNRLPANLLASILSVAARDGDDPRTATLRPILTGLPVAGGTGTLDAAHGRFQNASASDARGYVRAKTGTLSGVSTLAGVVLDNDGRLLVFAMMSNGTSPADARPALDDIAAALRDCGCT